MPPGTNLGGGELDDIELVKMSHSAVASASAAIIDLVQEDPTGERPFEVTETLENLADALQSALIISKRDDTEATQLLGAIGKFLDGWA